MAKKRVKINESSLKHIIMETVKRVLKETTDFAQVWGDENYDDMNRVNGVDPSKRRFIEDPSKFAQDLGQKKVSKFNRIHARPAQGKESLVTYKQDPSIAGTGEDNIETINDFEGGMVANNVNTPWQKYGIDQKTFDKKYEIDPENPSQYRPKGGPMLASKVHDDVAFPNPWGQGHMNVDKGGYMMQDPNNPSDTYGIQKGDYDSTYKEINEETKQKVNINEKQLKRIVSESVKRVLKEGLFDMFRRGPSAEEMEQQRLHNYYENNIISLLKKSAMSYEPHNGDANYVKMLQLAKEAYGKGIIKDHEFSNWFEKYYYEPRTKLLNQNNWLLRKGEKYPQDYWPSLETIK